MPPRINKKIFRNHSTLDWWNRPKIFNDDIIKYYNTIIVPDLQLAYTTLLNQPILCTVFEQTIHNSFFKGIHHFITQERFIVKWKENANVNITCSTCAYAIKDTLISAIVPMVKAQHFVFPESLRFCIVEINSMWCHICKVQLFKWYSHNQCISCHKQ